MVCDGFDTSLHITSRHLDSSLIADEQPDIRRGREFPADGLGRFASFQGNSNSCAMTTGLMEGLLHSLSDVAYQHPSTHVPSIMHSIAAIPLCEDDTEAAALLAWEARVCGVQPRDSPADAAARCLIHSPPEHFTAEGDCVTDYSEYPSVSVNVATSTVSTSAADTRSLLSRHLHQSSGPPDGSRSASLVREGSLQDPHSDCFTPRGVSHVYCDSGLDSEGWVEHPSTPTHHSSSLPQSAVPSGLVAADLARRSPSETLPSRYHLSLQAHVAKQALATSKSAPTAHLLSLLIPAYSTRAGSPITAGPLDPGTPLHAHQPTHPTHCPPKSHVCAASPCSSADSHRGMCLSNPGPAVISLSARACTGKPMPPPSHDPSQPTSQQGPDPNLDPSPFQQPTINIAVACQRTSIGRAPPLPEDLSCPDSPHSCSSGTNMRLISRMYSAAASALSFPVPFWLTSATVSSKRLAIPPPMADPMPARPRPRTSSNSCPCTPLHSSPRPQTPYPIPNTPAPFFSLPFFYQPLGPSEPIARPASLSIATPSQSAAPPSTTARSSYLQQQSLAGNPASLEVIAESVPLFASSTQPFEKGYIGPLATVVACPAEMQRKVWRLADFNVRSLLYSGYMSHVFLVSSDFSS